MWDKNWSQLLLAVYLCVLPSHQPGTQGAEPRLGVDAPAEGAGLLAYTPFQLDPGEILESNIPADPDSVLNNLEKPSNLTEPWTNPPRPDSTDPPPPPAQPWARHSPPSPHNYVNSPRPWTETKHLQTSPLKGFLIGPVQVELGPNSPLIRPRQPATADHIKPTPPQQEKSDLLAGAGNLLVKPSVSIQYLERSQNQGSTEMNILEPASTDSSVQNPGEETPAPGSLLDLSNPPFHIKKLEDSELFDAEEVANKPAETWVDAGGEGGDGDGADGDRDGADGDRDGVDGDGTGGDGVDGDGAGRSSPGVREYRAYASIDQKQDAYESNTDDKQKPNRRGWTGAEVLYENITRQLDNLDNLLQGDVDGGEVYAVPPHLRGWLDAGVSSPREHIEDSLDGFTNRTSDVQPLPEYTFFPGYHTQDDMRIDEDGSDEGGSDGDGYAEDSASSPRLERIVEARLSPAVDRFEVDHYVYHWNEDPIIERSDVSEEEEEEEKEDVFSSPNSFLEPEYAETTQFYPNLQLASAEYLGQFTPSPSDVGSEFNLNRFVPSEGLPNLNLGITEPSAVTEPLTSGERTKRREEEPKTTSTEGKVKTTSTEGSVKTTYTEGNVETTYTEGNVKTTSTEGKFKTTSTEGKVNQPKVDWDEAQFCALFKEECEDGDSGSPSEDEDVPAAPVKQSTEDARGRAALTEDITNGGKDEDKMKYSNKEENSQTTEDCKSGNKYDAELQCALPSEDDNYEEIKTEMEHLKKMYKEKINMEMRIQNKHKELEDKLKSKSKNPKYKDIYTQLSDNRTLGSDISNIHVMEIPLFQILQKQVVTVLREREQFFRDIVSTVDENVSLMREWLDIAKQTMIYQEEQGIVLFGEFSPVSNVLHAGISTVIALTEQFFLAVESINNIKSQILDSFVSGDGSEELFQRAQNFTVGELLPAKVSFIMNAYSNSEGIAKIFSDIVKNSNVLLETKYKVVQSIVNFGNKKMEIVRYYLGTNLSFLALLDSVQRGTFLRDINVGPMQFRGDQLFSRYEKEHILMNLLSMGNHRLPIVGIPVKEIFANTESIPQHVGRAERQKLIDRWLTKQLTTHLLNTFYTLYVKNGEAVVETSSPPLQLGNKCGLGFRFQGGKGRARIGRTSQVSLTAGPAFGYGRPPSLDVVVSAWLDTSLSYSTKVSVNASKGVFGHCISKFNQLVNAYVTAQAKSYISIKFSIIKLRLETRMAMDSNSNMYGLQVPHLVIKFALHLAGEVYTFNVERLKISNCHLKIMGMTLFSYCGLLEQILYKEIRQKTARTLPLSSPKVLRKIERAIMKRLGDEVAIPLFVLEERPVENFLQTANTIIKLGESLVRNMTDFQGQMTDIMSSYN